VNSDPDILLEVKNLAVHFPIRKGIFKRIRGYHKAVDNVSFSVKKGTTVGLVGESGSGKTTIARALVKLVPVTSGTINYEAIDVTTLTPKQFFPYRKKIQKIFPDPFSSLNPRMTLYAIISEALGIHFPHWNKQDKCERVVQLLRKVGLSADYMFHYPHQFSGGQRQRIGIARALSVEPEFIICDEPVSALDVSIQAQIVNLLQDLQEELGLSYLFIAHDLAVVEHISDYVLVMKKGKIVEQASTEEIYSSPKNPYTQKLLDSVPVI